MPETDVRTGLYARGFLLVVLALMCLGFLMVYSTTSVATRGRFSDTHFALRQIIWGAVAVLALAAALYVPARWLQRLAPILFAISVVLLALVLVVGTRYNGARRWFRFGVIGVQPSEVAKVAMIVFLARLLAVPAGRRARSLRTFVFAGAAAAVVCGLILVEPDLGCAFFLGGWTLIMLLVAGVRWWYVAGSVAAGGSAATWLVITSPMHLRRVTTFLDPWQDPQGAGHQLVQSLIALGSGGWRGVGLGLGQQRLSFLPESQTDFIFSIVGEQLGILGTGAIMALFGLMLYFGARVVSAAPNRFQFLMGFGALSMLIMQAALNVAVTTASMPTKGIALPLISFGGSGLVWAGAAAGLVLNIARSGEIRGKSGDINSRFMSPDFPVPGFPGNAE